MKILKISEDFTNAPGPRTIEQGQFSGELFRKNLLAPAYEEAKSHNVKLIVDLDGSYGYVTAFLEESFGGLQRDFPNDDLLKTIDIKSDEQPGRRDRIIAYIKNAKKGK